MDEVEILLAVVMVVGLVGVLVPVLPGLLLMAVAAVVWAFSSPGTGRWAVAAVVVAISVFATVAATVLPARRATAAGAPHTAVVAGAVGMVIGLIAVPVVGALIGFPAGIFLAEAVRLRDASAARATTVATLRGVGVGIAIQLAAGVVMMGIWFVAAIAG